MSNVPSNLKYTSSHEWARVEEDGSITIGITDHAQSMLGDIVFLELPEVDSEIDAGQEIGVVESVKAASDIYSPVSGTVTVINEALDSAPNLVNNDPYGAGWLFRVQPVDNEELEKLMGSAEYNAQIVSEGH